MSLWPGLTLCISFRHNTQSVAHGGLNSPYDAMRIGDYTGLRRHSSMNSVGPSSIGELRLYYKRSNQTPTRTNGATREAVHPLMVRSVRGASGRRRRKSFSTFGVCAGFQERLICVAGGLVSGAYNQGGSRRGTPSRRSQRDLGCADVHHSPSVFAGSNALATAMAWNHSMRSVLGCSE